MDFSVILDHVDGWGYNPYASIDVGKWVEGQISVDYLNEHYGKYETATKMKNATTSEGLRLYFDWLAEQGYLQP